MFCILFLREILSSSVFRFFLSNTTSCVTSFLTFGAYFSGFASLDARIDAFTFSGFLARYSAAYARFLAFSSSVYMRDILKLDFICI